MSEELNFYHDNWQKEKIFSSEIPRTADVGSCHKDNFPKVVE